MGVRCCTSVFDCITDFCAGDVALFCASWASAWMISPIQPRKSARPDPPSVRGFVSGRAFLTPGPSDPELRGGAPFRLDPLARPNSGLPRRRRFAPQGNWASDRDKWTDLSVFDSGRLSAGPAGPFPGL